MRTLAIQASGLLRAAERWLGLARPVAAAWAEALLTGGVDEREALMQRIEATDRLPLRDRLHAMLAPLPPPLQDDWQAIACHPDRPRLEDCAPACGQAWLVVHPRTGWGFAKRLPRSIFADDRQRQAWIDAQLALAKLDGSRLCTALAVQEDDEAVTLITPWLPGLDLTQRLAVKGPADEGRALALIASAAQALHQLHRAGFAHGHLKPGNLLIGPNGKVHLTDIGLARDARTDDLLRELSLESTGLRPWTAPEGQAGAGGAFPADCYALGAILFFLLSGRQPFSGRPERLAERHCRSERPDVRRFAPDTSELTAQTIVKLMRIDPTKRYQRPVEVYARMRANARALGRSTGSDAGATSESQDAVGAQAEEFLDLGELDELDGEIGTTNDDFLRLEDLAEPDDDEEFRLDD